VLAKYQGSFSYYVGTVQRIWQDSQTYEVLFDNGSKDGFVPGHSIQPLPRKLSEGCTETLAAIDLLNANFATLTKDQQAEVLFLYHADIRF
jgi:hypothetical protein